MLQSLLARMIGEPAYEEVGRLRSLNLIHAEPKGSTLELRTTKAFAEYFGIASTRPEEIRQFLEKKLGVSPGTLPAPAKAPEAPAAPPAEPVPPDGAFLENPTTPP